MSRDRLIEIHTQEDPHNLATDLERHITDDSRTTWTKGGVNTWVFESYQIAKTVIYKGMAPGPQDYTDIPLPRDYYDIFNDKGLD